MTKRILELFCGTKSVGKVFELAGYEVVSLDYNPKFKATHTEDILTWDYKQYSPDYFDVIWASPPCTYFSVASIGKHWNKDHTPKSKNALDGVKFVQSTLNIINYFLDKNPNLKFFIENPRGKLRKLDVVKGLERVTVWYCKYGDTRAKPTDVWSNHIYSIFNNAGWKPKNECFNGNKDCHHESAPRGSRTGTQGLRGNYNRSKIPQQLCEEILKSIDGSTKK